MTTDPRRLGFLLAVHRAGGVLAAADALHLTPSAVSQQIARLEAEEGVKVLDRGPRGVTLTPIGRILAETAERIEDEMVTARKQIAELDGQLSGKVVVGAFPTVAVSVLVPAVAQLKETLPGLDIEIQEREPQDALRGLRSGDLDIILHEADADAEHRAPRGLRDVPLLDEPWRLVMPTTMAVPTSLHEMADAQFLGPDPATAAARALARVSSAFGLSFDTRHKFYDFDVALGLISIGEGVALLPALALEHGIPEDIQVVALPGLGARRMMARHRVTRHEPGPAVDAVLNALTDAANELEFA